MKDGNEGRKMMKEGKVRGRRKEMKKVDKRRKSRKEANEGDRERLKTRGKRAKEGR